jgi:hypothetical protein
LFQRLHTSIKNARAEKGTQIYYNWYSKSDYKNWKRENVKILLKWKHIYGARGLSSIFEKHRSRLIKTYLIQNPDKLLLYYRGSYRIWSLISDNIIIWLSNQTDHVLNKLQLSTF